ncbi:hypothetical protein DFH09DRAFT_1434945 [Mycena vulgaris]|nr:hypothetical protein DFH09DRAFT_1434945 [Mycena vulgaris]
MCLKRLSSAWLLEQPAMALTEPGWSRGRFWEARQDDGRGRMEGKKERRRRGINQPTMRYNQPVVETGRLIIILHTCTYAAGARASQLALELEGGEESGPRRVLLPPPLIPADALMPSFCRRKRRGAIISPVATRSSTRAKERKRCQDVHVGACKEDLHQRYRARRPPGSTLAIAVYESTRASAKTRARRTPYPRIARFLALTSHRTLPSLGHKSSTASSSASAPRNAGVSARPRVRKGGHTPNPQPRSSPASHRARLGIIQAVEWPNRGGNARITHRMTHGGRARRPTSSGEGEAGSVCEAEVGDTKRNMGGGLDGEEWRSRGGAVAVGRRGGRTGGWGGGAGWDERVLDARRQEGGETEQRARVVHAESWDERRDMRRVEIPIRFSLARPVARSLEIHLAPLPARFPMPAFDLMPNAVSFALFSGSVLPASASTSILYGRCLVPGSLSLFHQYTIEGSVVWG